MKKRSDFKAASAGFRFSTPGFTLLRKPGAADDGVVRYGLTVTRKVGNAVIRNRIRRRLRAAIRALAQRHEGPAMDIVVLARASLLTLPFSSIEADLARAVAALGARPAAGPTRKPS
ncbi:ribonuclease P protein component [Rhabdaerophilum sp. SD176]|uniref:ribonuclease P protein component n=1 Tax=Rhabdaerophilum sp. SD176 TaxID=2983548 RepID=UPI0024E03513|nr:ribonuclease P protein component [Rhabdaerophilum sp. SD176]